MRYIYSMLSIMTIMLYGSELSITIDASPAIESIPDEIYSEDDLSETALAYFFRNNQVDDDYISFNKTSDCLRPYIKRHLCDEKRLSIRDALLQLNLLRNSFENHDEMPCLDKKLSNYLSDLISNSINEALLDREREARQYQQAMEERLTKAQTSLIAGICSVISASIAAGVTLAIHFSG